MLDTTADYLLRSGEEETYFLTSFLIGLIEEIMKMKPASILSSSEKEPTYTRSPPQRCTSRDVPNGF